MINLKLTPVNENNVPYYEVVFNYMIGDGNGYTTENFLCDSNEIEEVIKYVDILNRLKPLPRHWGICFNNYPEKYPGNYVGLTEEEYKIFISLLNLDDEDEDDTITPTIEISISDCLKDETEYSFLVFEGVNIYYYDENGKKFKVSWEKG